MSLYDERYKVIKEAIDKTMAEFSDKTPKIYKKLFYGAVDISPKYLVVWYIFEKDAELLTAKENGLCEELQNATINNLNLMGYPENAFNEDDIEDDAMISSTPKSAIINFTTHEDIERETGGDYHCYFQ